MSSSDTLTPSLRKAINSIIKKEKFSNFSVNTRVLPPDGGSFMGILREVNIKGEKENDIKELNLFIKSIIPGEQLSIYSVSDAYLKEAFAYKELFKIFDEVQDEANIPLNERYNTAIGYDESDGDSIILDNLAVKGFKTCDRLKVIPLRFAKLSIQKLAQLHSLSFVLQNKRPSYFETKVKTLEQPFNYGETPWKEFVANVSQIAMSCLEPEAKARVNKFLPTSYKKYAKYTTDYVGTKCLVHGDYRPNNIMVKSINGDFAEVIPIDYQLMFYGCPLIDFIYFIFGSTDQEFRERNLEYLKNKYYATMTKYLTMFKMDIHLLYPREEFEMMLKERLDYGLMIALWFIPTNLADEGEIPDVTKVNLAELKFNVNDVVKDRIRGVVDDFMQWGYL